MRSHAHHSPRRRPCRPQPPIQLKGKHQVGKLRLLICAHRAIPLRRLQIVEVNPAPLVRNRSNRHHARPLRLTHSRALQSGQQQRGQCEVAQYIGPKLQLETVKRLQPPPRSHHARVVDQQIEWKSQSHLRRSEPADRIQRRQIQQRDLRTRARDFRLKSRQRRVTSFLAAAAQQHVCSFAR